MDIPVTLINQALFNLIIGKEELIEKPKLPKIIWDKDTEEQIQGEYISVELEGENFSIEMKENSFVLKINDKEREIVPVFENEAIVKEKLTDKFLFLLKNEENKIFAARYGNRVYKKLNK